MTDIDKVVDRFWFGKYKGQKIVDIMRHNPGYIKWCLNSGALHQSQLPGAVEKEVDADRKIFEEFEDGLGEFFGDRDVPHEVSRTLTSLEVARINPKYDVHRSFPSDWPEQAFSRKEYHRPTKR